MGVYKLSSPKTFKQGGTPFTSMLAGNNTYNPGAYELIQTTTVSGGGVSSISFTSLGQYASTYQHLQLRAVVRGNRAADGDSMNLEFNSDTGANYSRHGVYSFGTGLSTYGLGSQTFFDLMNIPGTSSPSGMYSIAVADILDAFKAKNKTVRSLNGTPGLGNLVGIYTGGWYNTSSVTTIRVYPRFGSLLIAGTRVSLYGIKGA